MGVLFIGGLLFGTVLGRSFKVLILIPTCGLAVALLLAAPTSSAQSPMQLFLDIVLLVTGLQFGYFVGMFSTTVASVSQAIRKSLAPSSQSAGSRSLHVR
ncbi:hypothetical protein [Methylocapsa acidiphila]|uniref:hypothetical protein n=1 Tax=Methylocapsa acidiphila TaxID=133552 RepID=UPI0004786EB8|nr:hypothetical protein [Methylocapsa acidiphila]